jgi:hypothetical protein
MGEFPDTITGMLDTCRFAFSQLTESLFLAS